MNKLQLREDIRAAINRNSAENGSDTPDFILTDYIMSCLELFDKTVHERSHWYNHHCRIGGCNHVEKSEVVTGTCLICDSPRNGTDQYWCSKCVIEQRKESNLKNEIRNAVE